MRFVIHGAGAVGGTIGGRLAQAGHAVTLIARGAHGSALRERGLRLMSPDGDATLRLPVVEHPRELELSGDEVVVLAVKSQDTVAALDALAAAAPPSVTVVCAQNGVTNERAALRRFGDVVAMCVMMPVQQLEPGVVVAYCAPVTGLLDLGRYPDGRGERTEALAAALSGARFDVRVCSDIMRWKYKKLLVNLANAIIAACGHVFDDDGHELARRVRAEAASVLDAAGIDVASDEEDAARRGNILTPGQVEGRPRGGGSSWQSLARGTGTIEADYLNGEIVLLGRLHGVATPVNAMLQRLANELARERRSPGTLAAADLLARVTG